MNKERIIDKKGISLIVLVITIIVIIILAVAVILSIANNNPIEKAKEARFKNDVKAMQEELELLKASNYAKNNGVSYNDPEISIGDLKSATNYQEKFDVKDGELKYKEDKLTDEEKTWVSNLGVAEEIILKMGREITYKKEQFYIIGGDDVGKEVTDATQDILLLAKYNLKKENNEIILEQDTSGARNSCVFSSTNYWSSVEGITYPADLNDVEKYPIGSATSIITKAKAYGAKFGVTGRLMTYGEARALQTDYKAILYGKYTEESYLNYWLGSAERARNVWHVSGLGSERRLGLQQFRYLLEQRLRGPPSYKSLKVFDPISEHE